MIAWDGLPGTIRLLQDLPLEKFDGNLSDALTDWFYLNDKFDRGSKGMARLMRMTLDGNLAWVAFPPEGLRL